MGKQGRKDVCSGRMTCAVRNVFIGGRVTLTKILLAILLTKDLFIRRSFIHSFTQSTTTYLYTLSLILQHISTVDNPFLPSAPTSFLCPLILVSFLSILAHPPLLD